MSYYTVPHYNHTGTHTTYKHCSTSGNAPGKWWASSATLQSFRVPYIYLLRDAGVEWEAMRPWRRAVIGSADLEAHRAAYRLEVEQ